MLLKTRGIVFKTIKYGESSVIAEIFTEEKGRHTFIAGGVRAAKSRMPFSLFQPMSLVEMVTYFRDDEGALNRLKELRSDYIFQSIPFDIRRGAVALFLAEICTKTIREAEENRPLFEFLTENLIFLDATQQPIANIHLHFLIQLSNHLGFQPHRQTASGSAFFFDLKDGIFTDAPPMHHFFMEKTETLHLLALLQCPLNDCHSIKMSRAERKALLDKLLIFYSLHVPGFTEINTPEVLETVMGD